MDSNERMQFRKTQLRLLDAVHKICVGHGLKYWIDFGTLLGAVRHKGFIPWDDDIDVSMPKEDYKKFLAIAEKELPVDIFLQTPQTDKTYKQFFTKLRDCHSTFLEHHETDDGKYHKGIYIDIFPAIQYPKIPKFFKDVLVIVTMRARMKAILADKKTIKNYLNYPLYVICKFIWWVLSPFKGNEISQAPEDNGYRYYAPISYVYPLREIEFEGKLYPAPGKTHEYLTLIFKDYMTPPPVDKRVGHARLILPNKPCNHPRALNRLEKV